MRRLRRLLDIAHRRGAGYLVYLVTGFLFPRLAAWAIFESRFSARGRRLLGAFSGRVRRWDADASQGRHGGLPLRRKGTLKRPSEEPVLLGRIDNDGRVLALGPRPVDLPGLDEVSAADFVERYRYGLDLVLEDGAVLVRKDFRGDRRAFRREWHSLDALAGAAGCPTLHRVDERGLVLFKAFVPGPTLRQRLVRSGARILSVDTEADPELDGLDPEALIEAVWARGRSRFADALPPGTLDALESRLDAIHRRGVTGFSLSFGNVVLHEVTAEPCFIDFDAATTHPARAGWGFALGRDHDRDLFVRIYGRELLTERAARSLLRRIATPYSPVDLGRGMATRGFWSTDSGTGRWEYLNRRALAGWIEGRRILDLGSFNGLMPLLMLAAGACQVAAVEQSAELVERARALHRLFEWRDLRRYDLDLRRADMRSILGDDWGRFDLVTAFCSLYYLDEDDMARVVRRAAELAPVMVLQAKTDTRQTAAAGKAKRSSVAFLRALLEAHGFSQTEIVAPEGYSRPLLFGRVPGVGGSAVRT
jgi:hypothetical protein